jgi:hypothetical protein
MSGKSKVFLLLVTVVLLGIAIWFHPVQQTTNPQSASKPVLLSSQGIKQVTSTPASSTPVNAQSKPEALSSAIWLIVDEQADYVARLTAARTAITNLTTEDRQALYTFLQQRSPLDEDQRGHVLKNLLMDGLCALNPPPTGLGDVLAGVYQDKSQSVVLRDYAMQHMVAFYEQMEKTPDNGRNNLSQIRDTLWEALNETDSSIAGTALLGLEQLSEQRAEFDQNRIAEKALQLAGDNNAGELTHITAFQVCARLHVPDALPLLEQAASQGESVPLRISAIGALGTMGNAQAVPLLNSLLNGPEERLKLPAQNALTQIELKQRHAQATSM